jgi:hypothetical protein
MFKKKILKILLDFIKLRFCEHKFKGLLSYIFSKDKNENFEKLQKII